MGSANLSDLMKAVFAEDGNGSVPVPQPMIENGGIHITLKAHAICAKCTHYDDYFGDPEGVTLENFAKDATAYFSKKGWTTNRKRQRHCQTCSR